MKRSKIYRLTLFIVSILMLSALFLSACGDFREKSDETVDSSHTFETETTASTESSTITEELTQSAPEKKTMSAIDLSRSLSVFPGQRNVVIMGQEGSVTLDSIVKDYPTGPSGFGCYGYVRSSHYQSDPIQFTLDQSMVAMILVDGPYDLPPYYDFPATGKLVLYDGDNMYEVASNVYSFQLASNGEVLVYTAKTEDSEMCLFIWDADSGKSEKIQENVNPWYAVSLNGNAVAFSTNMSSGETVETYLFTMSELRLEKVADEIYPIAVSNDGRYIYGIEKMMGSNRLYVINNEHVQIIGDNISKYDLIYVNEDGSEVLFSTPEGIFTYQGEENEVLLEKDGKILDQITSIQFIQRYNYAEELFSEEVNSGLPSVCHVFSDCLVGNIFLISIVNDEDNTFWHFSDMMQGVSLKGVNASRSFYYFGDSLTFYDENSNQYVYIDNIYDNDLWADSSVYQYQYFEDISIFTMTSDQTMISLSSDDFICMHRWNGSSIETSCVPADLAKFAWMEEYGCSVFPRENEPDLIYYKVLESPASDDRLSRYVSSYYFSLYVIEDVPDAVPVLVAEQVSSVRAGEFGVYYTSLVSVSTNTINYYTEPYEYSSEDIFDQNAIYYSSDGMNFEYIADTYQRYIFGS